MRTTVDIPDSTYRMLKAKAASEGSTVKDLVLRGVAVVLVQDEGRRTRRLNLPLIESKEPGTLQIGNHEIYDLIGFP